MCVFSVINDVLIDRVCTVKLSYRPHPTNLHIEMLQFLRVFAPCIDGWWQFTTE